VGGGEEGRGRTTIYLALGEASSSIRGGGAERGAHLEVGVYETQTECGHAVDNVRLRMGAGFRWWSEPMTK
jgi:hypothetical protein